MTKRGIRGTRSLKGRMYMHSFYTRFVNIKRSCADSKDSAQPPSISDSDIKGSSLFGADLGADAGLDAVEGSLKMASLYFRAAVQAGACHQAHAGLQIDQTQTPLPMKPTKPRKLAQKCQNFLPPLSKISPPLVKTN